MALRRRRLLALASAGTMPSLAGCSPCGETWTGVGFAVEPLAVEGGDRWRVDARLSVEFDFGRDRYGLTGAALALFDADGAVLAEAPVGDLTWSDVPDGQRTETDCGDHATVTRERTLTANTFPRWVALRYDRFATAYDSQRTVARYRSATPGGGGTPDGYESVDAAAVASFEPAVEPAPPIADVRFDAGPLGCERRALEAEARTNVFLAVGGSRPLPAEHHHAVLERASVRDGELTLGIGLRSAPRFRRGECPRTRWTAGVDVAEPDAMPETVAVEYLDPEGDVAETARVAVRREAE